MSTLLTLNAGSVLPEKKFPSAQVVASPQFGVIGSVVKLDGRLSSDPDGLPLTYVWEFVSVPIGSKVKGEGFRLLDVDGDIVSFSPDIVGEYVVGLKVSNGMFESSQVLTSISIRALLVPHGRGLVPDGKFIWSYIRDIWTQVEGREWFETLWSALIQLVGTEMLKLYQVDFNKSIRDVQDLYQRRWLSYEPKLALSSSDLSFYLGNHMAGTDANTGSIGVTGLAVIFSANELIVYSGTVTPNVASEYVVIQSSQGPANIGTFQVEALNPNRTGYKLIGAPLDPVPDLIAEDLPITFAFQSKNWNILSIEPNNLALTMAEFGSPIDYLTPIFSDIESGVINRIRVGDIVHFPTGPNAGFYRIVEKSGSFLVVDRKPPSLHDLTAAATYLADVYRPVAINIEQPDEILSDTVSVQLTTDKDLSTLAPGRVIVVGGQTFTISRTSTDQNQRVPLAIITTDEKNIPAGLRSQFWRVPYTLVSESQDFEALGVSVGDLMIVEVVREDIQTTAEVVAQVVGVDGKRLGFVLTDAPVENGVVPDVPNKTYEELSSKFGLPQVSRLQDGTLFFSSVASELLEVVNSGKFQKTYWNTELTTDSILQVGSYSFTLHPKYILRNRLVPVDDDLASVPLLQEFIVQPTVVERDGKIFQVTHGQEFELKTKPSLLTENFDFVIDQDYALDTELTFQTGTSILEADDGDFIDRGVEPGDVVIIDEPLTLAGEYIINSVLDKERLQLVRPIPLYVLSDIVTAKVRIRRGRSGKFIRFTPRSFSAQKPSPARLWAEVSFFDNSQNIENNFGILVGLKKEDLDNVSRSINYRQAVAGLMFAFTKGSSIDRVRLGAQILLGLPFTEHRGVIRSIEENFRLDVKGEPVVGRILVEDIDSTGQALGTQRVYTFPVDAESSDLAGIETNPTTGKTYQVGDTVEIFQPLAKGVVIDDYLTKALPETFSDAAFLQQFHSIRVRINDNIFTLKELDLVSGFLKKITPAYISYAIVMTSEFIDNVDIVDVLRAAFRSGETVLVDNASFNITAALMFDSRTFSGISQMSLDDGVYWIRRVGNDLTTVDASTTVEVPAGGLINPRTDEEFEPPLVRPVDYLVIREGSNQGVYLIGSVPDDTHLLCTGDAPVNGFEAASGLKYYILRKVSSLLGGGSATATAASNTVSIGGTPALRTNGIAPGDWLILSDGANTASRHIIRKVKETTPASGVWNQVEVVPAPDFSGVRQYFFYRPTLMEAPLKGVQFDVESDGTNTLLDSGYPELRAIADVGDELVIDGDETTLRYLILDARNLYTTPALPVGTWTVRLYKKNRPSTTVGWDHIEKYDPLDEADVSLVETAADANCTGGSDIVSFTGYDPAALGVKPGDFLVLTSGGNSGNDVGYGLGVYPIVGVTSSTVVLSVSLTDSGAASWKIMRRR
jgi:hypothetical protein